MLKPLLLLASLALPCIAQEPALPPLERWNFPLAPVPTQVPEFKVEFESDPTPATKAWSVAGNDVIQQWWPAVWRMLATEGVTSPKTFKLRFNDKQKAPGYCTADGLYISVEWITKHPDDLGMIIHEMTHTIQGYKNTPRGDSWLVESIADYIRYWRYEPEKPKRKINPANGVKDSYGNGPTFLAWVIYRHDRRMLHVVDAALRSGKYNDEIFKQTTGKTLDELWTQFLTELPWNGVVSTT